AHEAETAVPFDGAGVRCEVAAERFEEGGLAPAVLADHGESVARGEGEVHLPQKHPVAAREAEAAGAKMRGGGGVSSGGGGVRRRPRTRRCAEEVVSAAVEGVCAVWCEVMSCLPVRGHRAWRSAARSGSGRRRVEGCRGAAVSGGRGGAARWSRRSGR